MDNNFDFSVNSLKVLEGRYLMRDKDRNICETPKQLLQRVASNIAAADVKYGENHILSCERFFEIMARREFLPNSPTLMNAGGAIQQLAGCFVLPVDDSMEGIFDAVKYTALIHQSGGGTGFSFSRLRPKGDVVKSTGGVASGPLSFMNVFNIATDTVKQGGKRRGANMGILRVDHPDILDFIIAKENEHSFANFNISVGLTKKFMQAVAERKDYELVNPRSKTIVKSLNAQEVYDLIIRMAWKNGEPGIIFLDRLNSPITNPTPHLGEIESTNPCITGDSLVSTELGLEKMENISNKANSQEVKIATDNRLSFDNGNGTLLISSQQTGTSLKTIAAAWKTGIKQTFKLTTKCGYELTATPDHKIMTENGWVKLIDLKAEDKILIQSGEGCFSQNYSLPENPFAEKWSKEIGQTMGFLIGDGWLIQQKNPRVGFTFSLHDLDVFNYFKSIINKLYKNEIKEITREKVIHLSYHSPKFVDFFIKLGVNPVKAGQKRIPQSIFSAPQEVVIGFLQGLFTADGTVARDKIKNNNYIRLTSKSFNLLKDVQKLLINLGLFSRIYDRSRKAQEKFSYTTIDGELKHYTTDGILYELQLSREMIPLYLKKIGFLSKKHDHKIKEFRNVHFYITSFHDQIKSIENAGEQTVYDLTEPATHSFIANGIVISNCGEQPLLPFEACNLGSINLERHVEKGQINWEKLKHTVHTAIHFLDNVIDMNKYPLENIRMMAQGNRKVGLGVMGWADMLIRLGIPYNSEEGVQLAEKVMKFIDEEAKKKSVEIAVRRGTFPNFKCSTYDTSREEDIVRNATRTTIAPTGSIGIIAGASSGIEPLFAISYIRKTPQFELVEVNPMFEEAAKEKGFYSEKLMKEIAEEGGIQNIAEIPEEVKKIFVTAMDITPEYHIRMQAAFQKYTNNAVSKTINFPFEATKEEVANAYMLAWELGCKGLTIYRNGSRDLQVLNIKKKDEKKTEKNKHEIMREGKCPECSNQIEVSEGCYTCHNCGFSACSV